MRFEITLESQFRDGRQSVAEAPFASDWNYDGAPLMQWTGLKDRNGKEIYEGDVVQIGSKKPVEVRWHKDTAGFLYIGMELMSNTEVIGNVWENSALLNPKSSEIGQHDEDVEGQVDEMRLNEMDRERDDHDDRVLNQ